MLVAVLLLGGCSVSRTFRDDTYTVQRGDTLSEIAAAYNIDWRELAQWNRIRPPYRLDVGQTLYLKPFPPIDYARIGQVNDRAPTPPATPSPRPSTAAASPRSPRSGRDARPSIASSDVASAPVSSRPTAATAARTAPTEPAAPAAASASSRDEAAEQHADASVTAASKTPAAQATQVSAAGPSEDGWQWPASGSLLRGYDPDDRHRGIEIGGSTGAPIYAASSGTVAYNGTGLKGYGQLIIIKHDEHYLSAYGFVKQSYVSQGQSVAAGAHIADMGLGPGNKPMLHFEIRRDGDPVDPETLLPAH